MTSAYHRNLVDKYETFILLIVKIFCGHQRSRAACTILVILSIALAILVQMHIAWATLKCLQDAQNSIEELCRLYKEESVGGNLCEDFCTDIIQTEACHTTHLAKEMVFSATYKKKRVVVKSKMWHLSDYEPLVINRDPHTGLPDLKIFAGMIQDAFRLHFRLPLDQLKFGNNGSAFLPTGFPWSIHPKSLSEASFASLWSLVQQEEYLMFGYFQNSNAFPRVLGTCGHVYVTEYLRPLSQLVDFDWPFRAEMGRRILALIEDLDIAFHQPLHLCDVKLDNFGIDSSANVKILDADNVYFAEVLRSTVAAQETCLSHSDCSFFSCKIRCDVQIGKCAHDVLNNNLQAVCENIFYGAWNNWIPMSEKSLLHSAPKHIKTTLHNTLAQCVDPENVKDPNIRGRAPYIIRQQIFRLLLGNN